MSWLELRIPPLAVVLAGAALMWLLARLAPLPAFSFPGGALLGSAIGLAGLIVILAGILEFRRASTTVNPVRPDTASTLVRTGIFRYSRNPMYLGFALVLTGFGAWLANPVSLLVVPGLVAYLNRFQIGPEERALRRIFGADYTAYQASVRRWL